MNLADAIRSAALRAEVVSAPNATPPVVRAAVTAPAPKVTPATDPSPEAPTDSTFSELVLKPEIPGSNLQNAPTQVQQTKRSNEMNTPEPTTAVQADSNQDLGTAVAHNSNTNMVRLELFLGPEQLQGLLRAMVQTHHSVMTLREAASYLRLTPTRLETLANDRMLPAFQIDGKWRFSKAGLDEWLTLQTGLAEHTPMENEA